MSENYSFDKFTSDSSDDYPKYADDIKIYRKEICLAEIRADRKRRLKELKETIAQLNPEAQFADGHDHAIMGYATDGRVIYSANQIVEGLMERDGMTPDEAIEFFNFNIECAYVGEYTPIYMYEE